MTYSLLKGEDMRLSARIMVMTGTLFALSETPFGQTMAAMAVGMNPLCQDVGQARSARIHPWGEGQMRLQDR